jgi:hypothetical protein
MRKLLRIVIIAARANGLQVITIRQGGKHTEMVADGGIVLRLSKGNRGDVNFKKILRDSVRKIANSEKRAQQETIYGTERASTGQVQR